MRSESSPDGVLRVRLCIVLYGMYQTFVRAITDTLVSQKDKRWWEASLVEKLALMHSFGEGEQKGMRTKILSVERFAKAKVVDLRLEAKLDTAQMVSSQQSGRCVRDVCDFVVRTDRFSSNAHASFGIWVNWTL